MGRVQVENNKNRSGVAGILVKLILAAVLIYAAVTLCDLQEQIQSARAQQAQLTVQVREITDKNNILRADIASAGDPEKLQDVARNELGMVKSDEKVFIFDNAY